MSTYDWSQIFGSAMGDILNGYAQQQQTTWTQQGCQPGHQVSFESLREAQRQMAGELGTQVTAELQERMELRRMGNLFLDASERGWKLRFEACGPFNATGQHSHARLVLRAPDGRIVKGKCRTSFKGNLTEGAELLAKEFLG